MALAGRRSSRSSRRRLLAVALLAASTCRPPDLTASGGCLPGFERLTARADRDATGDAPAEDLDAISVAAVGEVHAAGVEEAEPPVLRVRIAVRSGASRPGDSPVPRDDPFLSRLAAAMGTRPLFEADPDVEALAERLARLSARPAAPEAEAGGRTTGLEPFLVATVSLEPPAAGAAVREPTYVVGLTLATERTAAGAAPQAPPAVRWELELPVRAVRSDRLVTTVAQAIEARASVEIDRTVSAARATLAAVAGGTAEPDADEALFRAGPAAWGDLLAAVRDGTDPTRAAAARSLARAAAAALLPAYRAFLGDRDPAVRRAGLEAAWRLAAGRTPSLSAEDDRLPGPLDAWTLPPGGTACRGESPQLPGHAGREAAVRLLPGTRDLLGDADPDVAQGALVVLAEAGGVEEVRALRNAARHETSDEALDLLAVALGRLGDRSAIPRLRAAALRGGDASDIAALTLGFLRDRSADSALLAALSHGDARIRCAAAEALAGTRSASAPGALVGLLSAAEPPPVSRAAQGALVSLGRAAVPVLAAALAGDDPSVAWAAAEALGRIGDRSAVPALRARLETTDAGLRQRVAAALGRIGDPAALPSLVRSFEAEGGSADEAPVLAAVAAFGRNAVPVLLEGLSSESAAVRAGAVEALRRMGDREHPTLVAAMLEDDDARVRARAAAYLGASGDPRRAADLAALLRDPDEGAAIAAADALGSLGAAEGRLPLERALDPDRPGVAGAAARALAAIGSPESVAPVLAAATRMPPFDRGRLIDAVVAFGAAARAPLIRALGDGDLRPEALESLDGLRARLPVHVLEPHAGDSRERVRALVAALLGRTGDGAAAGPLVTLLSDDSASVREAAVSAAAALGGPEAVAALRERLRAEKDDWVVRAIRRALVRMGTVP